MNKVLCVVAVFALVFAIGCKDKAAKTTIVADTTKAVVEATKAAPVTPVADTVKAVAPAVKAAK